MIILLWWGTYLEVLPICGFLDVEFGVNASDGDAISEVLELTGWISEEQWLWGQSPRLRPPQSVVLTCGLESSGASLHVTFPDLLCWAQGKDEPRQDLGPLNTDLLGAWLGTLGVDGSRPAAIEQISLLVHFLEANRADLIFPGRPLDCRRSDHFKVVVAGGGGLGGHADLPVVCSRLAALIVWIMGALLVRRRLPRPVVAPT